MADKQKIMTPEEVQRAVSGGAYGAGAQPMQNPDYPVTGQAGQPMQQPGQMTSPTQTVTPQWMKYKDIQMTGNAATDYKALQGAQTGSYQSPYQPMIDQTIQSMAGRQPFRYDVNIDPLYQQLKDEYIKRGRQAMMDTQGQAAALSGGYGISWGAMAGGQAFQDSVGQLTGRIPELAQLANQMYMNEEQKDQNRIGLFQQIDDSWFGKYQYFDQDKQKQVADLYTKMKAASGGGSGKKKDPRTDAEWLIGLSDSAGYDVDASTDALAGQLNWTPEYTAAVKTIVHQYTDYQKEQQAREQAETDNAGILDIYDSLTKKPK